MNDAGCSANGGIDDALSKLHKNISNISDSLCQLESKLEPILIPENVPPEGNSVSEKPAYSPIHCEIDGINRGLGEINRRIISVFEQADLSRATVADRPKQAL